MICENGSNSLCNWNITQFPLGLGPHIHPPQHPSIEEHPNLYKRDIRSIKKKNYLFSFPQNISMAGTEPALSSITQLYNHLEELQEVFSYKKFDLFKSRRAFLPKGFKTFCHLVLKNISVFSQTSLVRKVGWSRCNRNISISRQGIE